MILRPEGLYCAAGDFYVDPWKPVTRALLTHAHADHARPGSQTYWAIASSVAILQHRLGQTASICSVSYGDVLRFGEAKVSFHPAGHVLGSAQIRVETQGQIWVITGDFKRAEDPTCVPFEPVACDTLITEATFALPIYRWQPASHVAHEIAAWVQQGHSQEFCCVLYCYAFGKAQRLLAELEPWMPGRTVFTHGAIEPLVEAYREQGVSLLPTVRVSEVPKDHKWAGELVFAPPSARGTAWLRRLGKHQSGFASGWMQVRGNRRRRFYDRGFVVSDHVDWPGLLQTVQESGARRVLATHGRADVLVRYLRELGLEADTLATQFAADSDEESVVQSS